MVRCGLCNGLFLAVDFEMAVRHLMSYHGVKTRDEAKHIATIKCDGHVDIALQTE